MDSITSVFDIFLHLDKVLPALANEYGVWIYAILFLVLFAETGLVITPFLPGDSLLLTAGVLAGVVVTPAVVEGGVVVQPATHVLDIWAVLAVCMAGAIIGDSTNYWIGRLAGKRIIDSGRVIKREYVEQTALFFEKHGGKTVTIARFFPIVRTFAPFMAGVGCMHYPRFLSFSVGGTIAWVGLFAGGGFLFGKIPGVQENLEYAVMFVLALSVIPAFYHWLQKRRAKAAGTLDEAGAAAAVAAIEDGCSLEDK